MTVFNYSGYGRSRPGRVSVQYQVNQVPEGFPNRPVLDLSENAAGGLGNAFVTVGDAFTGVFSFTDNVWQLGWAPGDPEPDRASDKPFSVSVWVQAANDVIGHGQIIGKYNANTAAEWLLYARQGDDPGDGEGSGLYWMMFSDGANYGGLVAHSGAAAQVGAAGNPPRVNTSARLRLYTPNTEVLENDRWYHILATYDGSATHEGLKLYLDGVEVRDIPGSNAVSDSNNYVGMLQTDLDLRIGKGSTLEFQRAITDAAIFDVELTQEDAYELYNKGVVLDLTKFSKFSNAVGWWPLGPGDAHPDAFERIAGRTGEVSANAVFNLVDQNSGSGPFATEGLDTQGQRYVNLTISEGLDLGNPGIEVWARTEFAGDNRWTKISAPPHKPSFATPNPGIVDSFVGVANSTVNYKIEIAGADRLFFIWDGNGGQVSLTATCSSF